MTSRGKFLGGQAKFWGGSGPRGTPLAPPLLRTHVNTQAHANNYCFMPYNLLTWLGEVQYLHTTIFVKPQQWPTPSESIAIYCVRKLVSCVTHLQSCAKVDIWNKNKKLRTVAKIKTQDYKIWRLQNLSTILTPPLNTVTTLFNEPRSQRPL